MIRKLFIISFLFIACILPSQASTPSVEALKGDANVEYGNYLSNLDSLLNLWYVKHVPGLESSHYYDYRKGDTLPVRFTPDVYRDKIKAINSVVELSYNSNVQAYINLYSIAKREQLETMLGLAEYYFPLFEQILDQVGVPEELKYLAIIESALNPRARSRVGAVGLWQFMYATGKMYGLRVDSYVDERHDPIRATYASAKFLKDLHGMFGDWVLALAAYNCGPGNVRKAIARSGGKRDYWEIYNYLPIETRGYVPAYIAAMYVMQHHKDHNLYVKPCALPMAIDTVVITQRVHFRQISDVMNIPVEQIRDLNPQYRLDIVPASTKPYAIVLPANFAEKFVSLQDSIYHYKDSIFFNPAIIAKAPASSKSQVAYKEPKKKTTPSSDKRNLSYTVRPGDNLGVISEKYNVSVADLRSWNSIKGSNIRPGQKLKIVAQSDSKTETKSKESSSVKSDDTESSKSVASAQSKQTEKDQDKVASVDKSKSKDSQKSDKSIDNDQSKVAGSDKSTKHVKETVAENEKSVEHSKTAVNDKSKSEKLAKNSSAEKSRSEKQLKVSATDKSKSEEQTKNVASEKEKTDEQTKIASNEKNKSSNKSDDADARHTESRSEKQGKYVYYQVKDGDTLWSISRKFEGVSEKDIMALNNISNARYIAVGQKLKIQEKR